MPKKIIIPPILPEPQLLKSIPPKEEIEILRDIAAQAQGWQEEAKRLADPPGAT